MRKTTKMFVLAVVCLMVCGNLAEAQFGWGGGSGSTPVLNHSFYLNNRPIYLRGTGDQNHYLRWQSGTNGPALFGYTGGALGVTNGGTRPILTWHNTAGVDIHTSMNVHGALMVHNSSFINGNLNVTQALTTDSLDVTNLNTRGLSLVNSELTSAHIQQTDGFVYYDKNFYEAGEGGDGYFEGNGGGLVRWHSEDGEGWTPILDTENMKYLNGEMHSMTIAEKTGAGTARVKYLTNYAGTDYEAGVYYNWYSGLHLHAGPKANATLSQSGIRIDNSNNVHMSDDLNISGAVRADKVGVDGLGALSLEFGTIGNSGSVSSLLGAIKAVPGEDSFGQLDFYAGDEISPELIVMSLSDSQVEINRDLTVSEGTITAHHLVVGKNHTAVDNEVDGEFHGSMVFYGPDGNDDDNLHINERIRGAYETHGSVIGIWSEELIVAPDIVFANPVDDPANPTDKFWPRVPDYVFEEDYKLLDLAELEKILKEEKSLPGIPNAAEINEKGFTQVQMNFGLLKKVEELTLYTIQQQKEIDRLRAIEERLNKLEALLNKKEE